MYVEDAEPGGLLRGDVLLDDTGDLGATLNIPGIGFLRAEFTEPHLARREISDDFARSTDLPGVWLPAAPFRGGDGGAPSRELF